VTAECIFNGGAFCVLYKLIYCTVSLSHRCRPSSSIDILHTVGNDSEQYTMSGVGWPCILLLLPCVVISTEYKADGGGALWSRCGNHCWSHRLSGAVHRTRSNHHLLSVSRPSVCLSVICLSLCLSVCRLSVYDIVMRQQV